MTFCKSGSKKESEANTTTQTLVGKRDDAIKNLVNILNSPPPGPENSVSLDPNKPDDYTIISAQNKEMTAEKLQELFNDPQFAELKEQYYAARKAAEDTDHQVETGTDTSTGEEGSFFHNLFFDQSPIQGNAKLSMVGMSFFMLFAMYNFWFAIKVDYEKGKHVHLERKFFGKIAYMRAIVGMGLGFGNLLIALEGYGGAWSQETFDLIANSVLMLDGVTMAAVGLGGLREIYKTRNKNSRGIIRGGFVDRMLDPGGLGEQEHLTPEQWKEYYEVLDYDTKKATPDKTIPDGAGKTKTNPDYVKHKVNIMRLNAMSEGEKNRAKKVYDLAKDFLDNSPNDDWQEKIKQSGIPISEFDNPYRAPIERITGKLKDGVHIPGIGKTKLPKLAWVIDKVVPEKLRNTRNGFAFAMVWVVIIGAVEVGVASTMFAVDASKDKKESSKEGLHLAEGENPDLKYFQYYYDLTQAVEALFAVHDQMYPSHH